MSADEADAIIEKPTDEADVELTSEEPKKEHHEVIAVIKKNDHKSMRKFIEEGQVDVDEPHNDEGDTKLHTAVFHRRDQVIEVLLAGGADFSIKNVAGETPLDLARSNRYPKCIAMLEAAETEKARKEQEMKDSIAADEAAAAAAAEEDRIRQEAEAKQAEEDDRLAEEQQAKKEKQAEEERLAAKQKADEVSAARNAATKQKEVELPKKKVVTTQPTPEASVPLWKENVCVIPDGITHQRVAIYTVNEWIGSRDPPTATMCCAHTSIDPHSCTLSTTHPSLYLHPSGTFMGDVMEKMGNPGRYAYKADECGHNEKYCLYPCLLGACFADSACCLFLPLTCYCMGAAKPNLDACGIKGPEVQVAREFIINHKGAVNKQWLKKNPGVKNRDFL